MKETQKWKQSLSLHIAFFSDMPFMAEAAWSSLGHQGVQLLPVPWLFRHWIPHNNTLF